MKRFTNDSNRKPKKLRIGRAENLMNLQRMYGNEPSFDGVTIADPDYNSRINNAYNWANAAFEPQMLKKITLEYLQEKEEYEFLKKLADYHFIGIGKDAWLRMSKCPTTQEMDAGFERRINELRIRHDKEQAEKQIENEQQEILEEDKISAEQAAVLQYVTMYALIDNMILKDTITDENVYELIRKNQPSATSLRMLLDHYLQNIVDSEEYEAGNKLKIAVKNFNKKMKTGAQIATKQIEKILVNVRAEKKLFKMRKPRVRKLKPANMQVKNLQFKENDNTLKMVSIPPTSIVHAETLVTFNTRTRKITIFYAKNTDGLTVKGTTIQNFDDEKSKQKTLRKPEQMIPMLIDTSLYRFEKVFEDIKAVQTKPKGRINEDVLLLKVFKLK